MSKEHDRIERAPRVCRPFTVRINEDLSAEHPRWEIVVAKDISASGILFNYNRYLPPGSRVDFRIALPACKPIECEGEVVRNVRGRFLDVGCSEPPVCFVAAIFQGLSEDDRTVMMEFLVQYDGEASGHKLVEEDPETTGSRTPREKRMERAFPFWIQRSEPAGWEPVPMRNISASGVLITCQEPLEIGAEISFRMVLPFLGAPVLCRGRVVRMDDKTCPGATLKFFDIGLEFSGLDEAVKQGLREHANNIGCE